MNELGAPHGIRAEMAVFGGTKMDEPARYRVIVDRISHEVEYLPRRDEARGAAGHLVINNPFWWTADDKYFNYSVMRSSDARFRRTVLLPQKGYPAGRRPDAGIAAEPASIPIDWDDLLDYVGLPGDPQAVFRRRLEARVQGQRQAGTARGVRPHVAVLHDAAAVHPLRPVRPLLHVRQDRHHAGRATTRIERRYLVDHDYLSAELGDRVVRDAQTINLALGYEMNTIEFAVQDGVPYAIDYLNPAPDFERDRITEFYFSHVVEKMAALVIDRALERPAVQSWPRWEEMLGIGPASGFTGAPGQPAR